MADPIGPLAVYKLDVEIFFAGPMPTDIPYPRKPASVNDAERDGIEALVELLRSRGFLCSQVGHGTLRIGTVLPEVDNDASH